ncbi:hydrocephalus-inducing protein homolog [Cuculus canorus]|uniref:hydrocephalus-inducing protein homolog n=1 Tax=Cuculus canorus TaxID=55661 RepID=UPI0023AACB32|nr:hydrocephalus-inducing protein homolog [Cuculus canorus]
MATRKICQPMGADRFQSKVAAPRDQKLVRMAGKPVTMTPAAFMKEKSLTTKQRLAATQEVKLPQITQLRDMREASHPKFSMVDLERSLFQPLPSEVVFQSYVPHEVYEMPLVLRNVDKVPRRLKIVMESSLYFKLDIPSGVCRKVAPGMTTSFHILFTPEENKDYFHQLTCITERGMFNVPIRAIGARAVLDFPDRLNFSICPVKYSTQMTLLVRNVGNREARYCISTQSPFSVNPSIGNLGTGEATRVTVEFHPLETGDHSGSLEVHYDTGEAIHTSLYGVAVDVNIGLDRSSLTVEKTCPTLSNCSTVVLHNRSEITAHFQWKSSATQEKEDQEKLRLCHRLQRSNENMELFDCTEDPILREHPPPLSATFKKARVQRDPMLFSDDVFTIDPVEGDVLPNSSIEINVIFKPREATVYRRVVYCDVSGRETSLPLCIEGEGIEPPLRLSFEQLDIGKVLIGSTNSYEVILFNKGAVDASFSLVHPTTALASCFTFDPWEGIISPDGLQVIKISFSSTILGKFKRAFKFRVKGSPEFVTLTIRGCVIGPTFHFNVPSLDFGVVSFGFPRTLSCCLNNTSSVPMTVDLRIPGDGSGEPSVTSSVLMLDNTHPSWRREDQGHRRPTEFTITPCRGTILPQGCLDIQVTLCSNTEKTYELALVVDVEGVGKNVSALLLTARCIVPALRVLNPVVTFGQCFLKVPYQQMLTLVNDSDVPGCYRVLPQDHKDAAAVWYSSPKPCGIIQPHSLVEVPFTLEAQMIGEQYTVAQIVACGSEVFPLEIHLVSVGEGPVVYVHPSKINFGRIQVLQDVSQTLHLSNQTLTPAPFRAEMVGKCSRWRIEPSKGVIPPNTELAVAVIANLDDTEIFKDEVKVFVENSLSYIIPVQAVGIGTTIVTDKPITPELSLGPQYSLVPFCYHFKVTNKGRRTHILYWTTEGFSTFRQRHHLPVLGSTKGGNSTQNSKSACPVFKLRPLRVELMPGRSMDMVLEGFSSTPEVVKERLLCHAVVGSKAGKVQIMQVDVTCEFIAPVLQVSSREVTFRVVKQPSDVLTLQHKPLSLKNISLLPLSIVLALEQPFLICDADEQPLPADVQHVKLEAGEELHLSIRFNPAYEEGLNIRKVEKTLKIKFLEHPHEEQVTIRGEVYFPNLHIPTTALDFGCILNDTETVRYIEMTNCSPLPVRYHWVFLTNSPASQMRFRPPTSQFFIKLQPRKEERAQSECSAYAEGSSKERSVDADDSLEAEVFHILPLYGVLQPSQSQRVAFTFFGHADIAARIMALCRVEGGPTYEVALSGEASLINYLLDVTEIDYGLQLFNKVAEAEVTLWNNGKVGFTYAVLNPSVATADCPQPREPMVLPSTGYLGPGKKQVLKVYYLPGVPGVFFRTFQVQVGYLEPEEISLKGEGNFPRFSLDLPRNIKGNEKYEKVLKEAKEKMEQDNQRDQANVLGEALAAEAPTDSSDTMLEPWLQMRMEDLLLEEHALEQQKALASNAPGDSGFDQHAHWRLLEAELPEYILDFGYVIPGSIHTHTVTVTNTGHFPVSFHIGGRVLRGTGFSVKPNRIEDLPCCKTQTFEVRFDLGSANLPLGEVDRLLPIKVAEGPTFHIRLRANVTLPSLCLSKDSLEFSAVQCGQCQEETVQFHNQLEVPCTWFLTINEPVKKVDKQVRGTVRRKMLQEPNSKPHVFTALPSAGVLSPGQRCNVRIRFSPTEEKSYKNILKINISQSSQHLQLLVSGHGLKPQLEFCPKVLELGPLLPDGHGVEGTVVVKNPCKFPIEFYSLEFDKEYLAEEQILRMLKEYNSQNTLLLPPRAPGEKLPVEVLEYYEDQKRLQDEQAKSGTVEPAGQANGNFEGTQSLSDEGRKPSAGIIHNISFHSSITPSLVFGENQSNKVDCKPECGKKERVIEKRHNTAEHWQSTASSVEAAGEQDDSPVYRAIARHLGIDISAEGRAAQKRRGIVVIIHGAPLTGKTSAATALSKYYGAACLSIDAVVKEAMSDRRSLAGLRARELCMAAALEQSYKETENAGKERRWTQSSESADVSTRRKSTVGSKRSMQVSQSGFKRKESLRPTRPRVQGSQPIFPLLCIPAPRRLSISGSTAGETGFMSCVLPEDLLVAILSERLKLSDCYQGVVFDSLETLFARNMASALLCLLKAVGNRPHIYFVNLSQDYASWKARETAMKEQKEREQEEATRREKERLWKVNEEEYDALTEEEKTQLNNNIRQVQRERKKREIEQLAQELKEKQQQELKGLEEELSTSSKAEKKRLGKDKNTALRSESQPGEKQNMNSPTSIVSPGIQPSVNEWVKKKGSVKEDPSCVSSDKEVTKQRGKVPLIAACPAVGVEPADPGLWETENEALSDSEKNLALRFKIYEASQKGIAHILSSWDRAQGILLSPLRHAEDHLKQLYISRSWMDRKKARPEKVCGEKRHQDKKWLGKLKALKESKLSVLKEEIMEESSIGQDGRVPCVEMQVLNTEDVTRKILESGKLPAAEQILDELGLGPSGPPVPATAFYSVVHYPEKRMAPAAEAVKHFFFVASEEATVEGKKKRTSSHSRLLTVKKSEELATLTRGRLKEQKALHGPKTSRNRLSPSQGRIHYRGSTSSLKVKKSGVHMVPCSERPARWIVPAHGEVELKVRFSSTEPGQFDQMLHFEIVGTKRRYELQCRGTCLPVSTISQDPQYKVQHCPNNCEKITILNVTSWEEEVQFFFDHDRKMETFHLDPSSMRLKPKEKQELWVELEVSPTKVHFNRCHFTPQSHVGQQ